MSKINAANTTVSAKRASKLRTIKDIPRDYSISREEIGKAVDTVYNKRTYHVSRSKGGEWVVKKGNTIRYCEQKGNSRDKKDSRETHTSTHFPTQKEALNHARKLCKNGEYELVVHGIDGRIRESSRHGIKSKK